MTRAPRQLRYEPLADPLPGPVPQVRRVIAIAATPRCGTNLLAGALGATGRAGVPQEMLRPDSLLRGREEFGVPRTRVTRVPYAVLRRLSASPRWSYDRTMGDAARREIADFHARRYTTPNGVFAVKYMWSHFEPAIDTPLDATTWAVPVTWLRQRRRDRALQAVSYMRALVTGHYGHHGSTPAGAYDADRIAAAAALLADWERSWDAYLAARGIDPLVVWYEDLEQDYAGTVRAVFDHLGLEGVPVPPPQLRKQGDESSLEWAARFRAERPDAGLDGAS